MLVHLRRSVIVSAIFIVVLGLAYPLVATGVSQVLFNHQANGSLTANGSTLIGQKWNGPRWFQGRPDPYTPMASGGSNLGPRSKTLLNDVKKQMSSLEKEGIEPTPGLVTGSGSGLDPDISPADAYTQVDAVAKANDLAVSKVRDLVASQIRPAELGFLGAQYVNVLSLNEGLDKLR